ncbi:CHASE domain-containing protein [Ahrensia sp. 13_GOM-1096m]|uniref:CHASE domain-containing protein n=1 Tax=Ahrensia sp. 13_GOM-1096m TaxID=1380380 RepID=UPI0009DE92AD|nr:CHASE domain-containing protein [Ahrensia sp. 13_GOM-1096m]
MMRNRLPTILFSVTMLLGLVAAYAVYNSTRQAERASFDIVADDIIDNLEEGVKQHVALLSATRSLVNTVDIDDKGSGFKEFVADLGLVENYRGIQGLGLAPIFVSGNELAAENEIKRNYNLERKLYPASDQSFRVPVLLLEPNDERNQKALGYDMFAESNRRDAMIAAARDRRPSATAPVRLVQEIDSDQQLGFLIYAPIKQKNIDVVRIANNYQPLTGFVFAAFRIGDLHNAALSRTLSSALGLYVQTIDKTDNIETVVFQSKNYENYADKNGLRSVKTINMAGRAWEVEVIKPASGSLDSSLLYALMTGLLSFLFAGALASSSKLQLSSLRDSEELRLYSEKAAQDKDLMLQEMKHRIKNSIARINSIARQTARSSKDLPEFTKSFSERLQAMATAQDVLARSKWQRASFGDLLKSELEQVFGKNANEVKLIGPEVSLDEKYSQAFGLVLHELATNSLKYGGMSGTENAMQINWKIKKLPKRKRGLSIVWRENFTGEKTETVSAGGGFGTKLINANIVGELGGSFDRSFDEKGMIVKIDVPLTQ